MAPCGAILLYSLESPRRGSLLRLVTCIQDNTLAVSNKRVLTQRIVVDPLVNCDGHILRVRGLCAVCRCWEGTVDDLDNVCTFDNGKAIVRVDRVKGVFECLELDVQDVFDERNYVRFDLLRIHRILLLIKSRNWTLKILFSLT